MQTLHVEEEGHSAPLEIEAAYTIHETQGVKECVVRAVEVWNGNLHTNRLQDVTETEWAIIEEHLPHSRALLDEVAPKRPRRVGGPLARTVRFGHRPAHFA